MPVRRSLDNNGRKRNCHVALAGRSERVNPHPRLKLGGSLAYVGDELAPTPAAPVLGERIGDGLWEFSLGVYLVVRGFRPEAVDRLLASR